MMSTSKFLPFVLCAGLMVPGTMAHAASVTFDLQTLVSVGGPDNRDLDEVEESQLVPLTDHLSNSVSAEVDDRFGPGQGRAEAAYDINQETGAIKFGARADVTAPTSQINSRSTAFVSLFVAETFQITGTGDIRFRLALEGSLSNQGTRRDGGDGSNVQAFFRLIDTSGGFAILGSDTFVQNAPFGSSAIVDDVLEFTASITESKSYLFNMSFLSSAAVTEKGFGNSGASTSDFLNTAFLSFEADDTLTVTASDPNFLSNVGGNPISAVPLPASGLVLITGVLGLFGLRRRKAI